MQLRIAVENGNDGRSLAWALDHPGCFLYGKDESEVIINLPLAFLRYANWISTHTERSWLKTDHIDVRLVEVWQCYFINEAYLVSNDGTEINAWFRDDWRPLTREEVERGRQLLQWSREDLLKATDGLTTEQLGWHTSDVVHWTISRIIEHIANAECWYLDRLDLAPWKRSELPQEPFQRLQFVRKQVMQILEKLVEMEKVVGREGEFWSPRKMLRRLLYHEPDHREHIQQILIEHR